MAANNGNPGQQTNLQLITCTVQRGKADEVVKAAMKAGAPAATIHFARGTGIRERLGLLRIVISPEKEVVQIVVFDQDVDAVFDSMVEAGKLDTPGMGFIFTTPVNRATIPFSE